MDSIVCGVLRVMWTRQLQFDDPGPNRELYSHPKNIEYSAYDAEMRAVKHNASARHAHSHRSRRYVPGRLYVHCKENMYVFHPYSTITRCTWYLYLFQHVQDITLPPCFFWLSGPLLLPPAFSLREAVVSQSALLLRQDHRR